MRERDRLRLLKVGVTGDHSLSVGLSQSDQGVDEAGQLVSSAFTGFSEVQAKIQGDLVITRSPRVELPAGISDDFDNAPLHSRVHVFVRLDELNCAIVGVGKQLLQRFVDLGVLLIGEQPDIGEHPNMGKRTPNIN